MTGVKILKPSRSSHLFYETKSQEQSFGEMLKKFDNWKLENRDGKRPKDRGCSDIKDKLFSCTKIRAKKHKQEKCGTSRLILREKCVKLAVHLDIEKLKFSGGSISDTLRGHVIKTVIMIFQRKTLRK